MRYSVTVLAALLSGAALAENRIFKTIGDNECQACLADVESVCKGPVSSDQFNDCLCSANGDAFAKLKECLAETSCAEDEYDVLSYYGSHCFAWKDDEEEEFCTDESQDDDIKLSVADMFCTEFITLSGTRTTEAASSTAISDAESTTSDDAGVTTTTSSQTSSVRTRSTVVPTGVPDQDGPDDDDDDSDDSDDADDSDEAASSSSQSDDDSDDSDNAGTTLAAGGMTGLAILALWGYVMVVRLL